MLSWQPSAPPRQLDFGDVMLILRKSVVPRARYLASVMPPDVLVVVAAEWDAAIEKLGWQI